jgi:integrase
MSNQIVLNSVFAPYFNSFLEMKGTLGFGTEAIKCFFRELDRFFIENNITDVYITRTHISLWNVTRVNDHKQTLYHKYSILRQFCRYLDHLGKECYIPKLPKNVKSDFIPFIFTHEQIKLIFEASDKLVETKRCSKDCIIFAMPALLRFLYSTGVRINEALSIKNEDVDLAHQRIILKKTKNRMQRLIPVNPSLLAVLKQYVKYRNRMPLQFVSSPDHFFFVSPAGKPLADYSVLRWFRKILKDCIIPNSYAIRIHDIRHTCAVHSLIKMINEGVDIYCALPVLSVFLGHQKVESTENYVRLTQEIYPEIIKMEQSVTSFVFPKINFKTECDYDNN